MQTIEEMRAELTAEAIRRRLRPLSY